MNKSKEGCGPPFLITGKSDPLHEVCIEHDRAYDDARTPSGEFDADKLRDADIAFLNQSWAITTHSVLARLHAFSYLVLMTPWRLARNIIRRVIP